MKKLTDEQIREIYADAKREFAADQERMRKEQEEDRKLRIETASKCVNDVVYRARNERLCSMIGGAVYQRKISGSLSRTSGVPTPGRESIEAIFQRKLLGVCAEVRTVEQAKQSNCLPE